MKIVELIKEKIEHKAFMIQVEEGIKHPSTYDAMLEKFTVLEIKKMIDEAIEEYKQNINLQESAQPLVEYLQTHYHPHCTAIVDQIHAEILEGVEVAKYEPLD